MQNVEKSVKKQSVREYKALIKAPPSEERSKFETEPHNLKPFEDWSSSKKDRSSPEKQPPNSE